MIWPNAESAANSDPWLVAHHDEITRMRPRVLGVNFVHGLSEPEARRQLQTLSAVLAESSRWQGYRDPRAPVFLDYQVGEIVDCTEPRGGWTATAPSSRGRRRRPARLRARSTS